MLTDSGGVQEETCIQTLGKFDQQTFKKSLTKNATHASLNWKNPFGDGKAGNIRGGLKYPGGNKA